MYDVLILSLVNPGECAGSRVPVLHCADALREAGASVETIVAVDDREIDSVLARLPEERLIVAAASDGQLRHVVRRMVRRYAPPPSQRPAELPANRTVPDLPTIGVLPLGQRTGLTALLGLPHEPEAVAQAVLAKHRRTLDLLRNDGGSVTLDGVLMTGRWQGRVELDDAVLSDGTDTILALTIANAGGTATFDGLPLVERTDPGDGLIDVAVAVPITHRRRLRFEVRRARGRAASVTPLSEQVLSDDGVEGTLNRKRSWWVEPGAWSVYTSQTGGA